MKARLANLKVVIGIDQGKLKQLNKDLKKTRGMFRRDFGAIQSTVRNVGRNMTAGITAPLALMGAQSVKAFDQQQKAIAQVEAGLKSTAGQVGYTSQQLQKMASDLQTKTLFGDEQILADATAQLLTFTNISGEQFARTQSAALDLATRLDGDLKGASIQLGKALNDPIANLSALSRSGIQFSADQKEVIKSLAETGRMAEAQTIILDELEKQYGGSAEAAAKAGMGPFKQLQNTIGDLSEEFGKLIAEVLTPLIPKITAIVRSISGMSDGVKRSILAVAAVLGTAGPLAMAIAALMPIIGALTGPIGLIITAVAALTTAVSYFRNEIAGPLASVANFFIDIYNEVAPVRVAIAVLTTAVKSNFKIITTAARAVFDSIKTIGDALIALVMEGDVEKAKQIFLNGFKDIGDDIFDAAVSMGEEFAAGVTDGVRNRIERVDAAEIASALDLGNMLTGGGAGTTAVETSLPRMVEMSRRATEQISSHNATLKGSYEEVGASIEATQTKTSELDKMFTEAARSMAVSAGMIAGAMMAGTASARDMGNMVLDTLAGLAIEVGQMAIATGLAIEGIKSALKTLNPAAALAAGIALVALGSFVRSSLSKKAGIGDVPQMAEGGLFSGASLAYVGEGPGTSMINPEVVAPLDKLQQMMGGGHVTVTGMIRGSDILISNERATLDRNRVRGF